MQHGLIITKSDLSIIDATPGCRCFFNRSMLKKRMNLFDCIPSLRTTLNPHFLKEGGLAEGVVMETGIYSVRVFPAEKHIIFLFQSEDGSLTEMANVSKFAELKKRNEFLESIIEEAPIGLILCDEKGTIIYVNKKQEQNSRQKRQQLIGRDIREVYQKAFEYSEITNLFYRVANGAVFSETLIVDHYYPQFYKKDMIIKFVATRLKEHKRVTVFVGIEDELYREKRKAEKAGEDLRMSQNYMAQLLDSSPNMVISVDNKRRVVSFNKTAERLLGFQASEVYNSPVDRFFPKEELLKLDMAFTASDLWYGRAHIHRSDKSTFPIELYTNKIKDEKTGKDIATLLLAVDIEERSKFRQNLIQYQKMNFIGELVNGLAHQINNPLVGVINIADILLQMINVGDERYAYIKMIREAGESCKEVISRMLRFSRRQEGVPHMEIDVRSVLDAGIEMLMKHPDFKKVKVERNYQEVSLISGDPVLLQQAFMNMLINSAQALQCQGIIKVGCSYDNARCKQVVVTIWDGGCGIPEGIISKIFEPFFSTKNVDDGTGIGLSLTYWIIQDHGGRISVESLEGKGTTFAIYLPVKGKECYE